jgi:hypothetical protein
LTCGILAFVTTTTSAAGHVPLRGKFTATGSSISRDVAAINALQGVREGLDNWCNWEASAWVIEGMYINRHYIYVRGK